MAGKRDFDNLAKSIAGAVILASNVLQSVEIDLELPRGFIAKIYKVEFMLLDTSKDFAIFVTEGNNAVDFLMGLINDPDDISNILTTSNRVNHDVIAEYAPDFWADIGAVDPDGRGPVVLDFKKTVDFPEHIDVIAFRNLRFNAVAGGSADSSITETIAKVIVHYTLEAVTDADIMNLLDIL